MEYTALNSYRKRLLNMRIAYGFNSLNGVCNGELLRLYTLISNSGNSVNENAKICFLSFKMSVSFVLWKELSQTICFWNYIHMLKK